MEEQVKALLKVKVKKEDNKDEDESEDLKDLKEKLKKLGIEKTQVNYVRKGESQRGYARGS